jgi:hypothetical protein
VTGNGNEVPCRGAGLVGSHWQACCGPAAEAAVQHLHLVVPEEPQRPPGAGGDGRVTIVVDDDRLTRQDAHPVHGRLEDCSVRQRMPASRTGRAGKIGVEIHVACSGQVPGPVAVDTRRPAQLPPDVKQHRGLPAGQLAGQGYHVDQRMDGQASGGLAAASRGHGFAARLSQATTSAACRSGGNTG